MESVNTIKIGHSIGQQINLFSKSVSLMLGGFVALVFALFIMANISLSDIIAWSSKVLGASFIAMMAGLVFITIYALVKVEKSAKRGKYDKAWLEAGYQAANGITSLALTFTLFGISLGIGTLAEQNLSPETIQQVTKALTAKFALAFMTTVVGLPLSTFLRAVLSVYQAKLESKFES